MVIKEENEPEKKEEINLKLEDNKIEIKEQPKGLRSKKKEKQKIIDIPDTMETEKEDKANKKIIEENTKEQEDKDGLKRGKCNCLIF